ncbi:GSCOCG00010462001-RA-CDS [Cotesia congregata]|uniref:Mitochondrial (Mus musculus) n=1 Tax=Cotesia congregata TaxID=51543 RepID=A0A8J2MJ95_COTCN|nr:GSCOCG00010462001-RA-CDS [Cotesia congregata]CAG5085375.1 Similar to Higd1a: HIG1 domain family member 1A [Cotesia congregata]
MDRRREIIIDETPMQQMWRSFSGNPFLMIGVTGFIATAIIGGYRFAKRPKDSPPSLFLIQLRVTAQSVVVGSLGIGMLYGMVDHWILNPKPKRKAIADAENK